MSRIVVYHFHLLPFPATSSHSLQRNFGFLTPLPWQCRVRSIILPFNFISIFNIWHDTSWFVGLCLHSFFKSVSLSYQYQYHHYPSSSSSTWPTSSDCAVCCRKSWDCTCRHQCIIPFVWLQPSNHEHKTHSTVGAWCRQLVESSDRGPYFTRVIIRQWPPRFGAFGWATRAPFYTTLCMVYIAKCN